MQTRIKQTIAAVATVAATFGLGLVYAQSTTGQSATGGAAAGGVTGSSAPAEATEGTPRLNPNNSNSSNVNSSSSDSSAPAPAATDSSSDSLAPRADRN